MRRDQQQELQPLAVAWGIDVHDPALVKDACNCSGFVYWALGFARHTAPTPFTDPNGWIFIDIIWADAKGPGVRFQAIDGSRPGVLVVYPKECSGHSHGHVGLVVEADAAGRATRVGHCSAVNAGTMQFVAIKFTAPEVIEQPARTIYA